MKIDSIVRLDADGDIVENTRKYLQSLGLVVKAVNNESPGGPELYFTNQTGKTGESKKKIERLAYCLPAGVKLNGKQTGWIDNHRKYKIIIFLEHVTDQAIELMIREMTFLEDRVRVLKEKAESLERETNELAILKKELGATVR